ncbi:MAG: hypothetical protein WC544_00630 [Patescibacteria group bacterium]
MLRSNSLKMVGLLLIAVFLLVSISAPAFAKGSGKYDKYAPKQTSQHQSAGKDNGISMPVKAGAGILIIFVAGGWIMGRRSDGTVTPLARVDSATPRGDISKNSGR